MWFAKMVFLTIIFKKGARFLPYMDNNCDIDADNEPLPEHHELEAMLGNINPRHLMDKCHTNINAHELLMRSFFDSFASEVRVYEFDTARDMWMPEYRPHRIVQEVYFKKGVLAIIYDGPFYDIFPLPDLRDNKYTGSLVYMDLLPRHDSYGALALYMDWNVANGSKRLLSRRKLFLGGWE